MTTQSELAKFNAKSGCYVGSDSYLPMVTFSTERQQISLPYHALTMAIMDEKEEAIVLSFGDMDALLYGSSLGRIFDLFTQHRLARVQAIQAPTEQKETVIHAIAVGPRQQDVEKTGKGI